jgi:ABC-type transporter Mla subunit MlaD
MSDAQERAYTHDEQLRNAAESYARLHESVERQRKTIADAQAKLDSLMNEGERLSKQLASFVNETNDELHLRVGDNLVHVKWKEGTDTAVRLVKLA